MSRKQNFLIVTILGAICIFGLEAQATTLASDNFTLSVGTNLATMTDTESAGVGTYTVIQGTPTNALSATNITALGFGDGNVLRWPGGGQTYYRAFNGATTLKLNDLSTGETLRLAFDIRFAGGLNNADNFSFGFICFPQPTSVIYANLDLFDGGSGLDSEFRYRSGSFNLADLGTQINSTFIEPATAVGVGYAMKLEVTRLTNGFLLGSYRDGVRAGATTALTASAFVTAMGNTNITGIAFRGITPATVYIDNLLVERALPLPIPSISGIAPSPAITYGASGVTLTGLVSAAGPVYPADGETVAITINGVSSNAMIAGGEGGFSVVYPTAGLGVTGSPYTITYAYAGGSNLAAAATDTSTVLTVNKATPAIEGVTASQSIPFGTESVTLTGLVSAAGPVYPADGEFVAVTINSVSSNAVIAGGAGGFSVVVPTAALTVGGSPYAITYAYAGNENLNAATDEESTALTIESSGSEPVAGSTNTSISVVSSQLQIGFALESGAVYRVQASVNLLDGSGWTDVTDKLTNDAGSSATFIDVNAASLPARTYRISSP